MDHSRGGQWWAHMLGYFSKVRGYWQLEGRAVAGSHAGLLLQGKGVLAVGGEGSGGLTCLATSPR